MRWTGREITASSLYSHVFVIGGNINNDNNNL